MARTDFTLENSELFEAENATDASTNFFFCNDLVEKRRYIYFKSGPFGSPNSECGTERSRMRKNGISWTTIGRQCVNGLQLFKVNF